MLPPPGFEQGTMVCRLNRSVEGTKQAANEFMNLNVTTIEKEGFERDLTDPNLFKRTKNGINLRLGVYVDNILLAYPRNNAAARKQMEEFLSSYEKTIRIERRGKPHSFMGVEINYNMEDGHIHLGQKQYIEQTFKQFCSNSTMSFL